MKDGIKEIIGKTVSGAVVGKNSRQPHVQLMLTFTDGTYFEIWGDSFTCAGGVDKGNAETASAYVTSMGGSVTQRYP